MLENTRIRLDGARYAMVGMTILLLLVVAPLAAATGPEGVGSFSGDDAYDPAAGGNPDGEIFGFACLLSTTGMQ